MSGGFTERQQASGPESAAPKRTILPPATKEDMIASEAVHDIVTNYRVAGHDPEAFPENVAKRIADRKKEIAGIVSLESDALTGGRKIEKEPPHRIPKE